MMLISLLLILIVGINIGYGEWTLDSPLPLTHRLDLMPEHYLALQTSRRVQILNFLTFSDIHIMDKEAPNQLIYFQQAEPQFFTGVLDGASPFGKVIYAGPVSDMAFSLVLISSIKRNHQDSHPIALFQIQRCRSRSLCLTIHSVRMTAQMTFKAMAIWMLSAGPGCKRSDPFQFMVPITQNYANNSVPK